MRFVFGKDPAVISRSTFDRRGRKHAVAKYTIRRTLLAGGMTAGGWSAIAADVTYERLLEPEPQNWLMNHRTYDGQRFSPLDHVNRNNVRNLKVAYAVALGGAGRNEFNEATPLADGGFLYTVDSSGV